jgi:hypothetical protein
MKGISDWASIEDYLKKFNLDKYVIEEVAFYGAGVHATERLDRASLECNGYALKRSGVVQDFDTNALLQSIESGEGTYKV